MSGISQSFDVQGGEERSLRKSATCDATSVVTRTKGTNVVTGRHKKVVCNLLSGLMVDRALTKLLSKAIRVYFEKSRVERNS